MNDRYLYRAKRTDNGEWVKGSLCYKKAYCFDNRTKPKAVIITEYSNTGVVNFDIDENTICQCSGLKDKNGNLIWENDIVKHDFGKDQIGVQLAIVKYDSKYACYQIKPIYDWMYCDKSDCEVIGNIFDNPELLEVGHE